MFSTGLQSLDQILGDGYPDRSSILVVGQPGIGKEGLGYWFASSGILRDDYCLYVTYRSVMDVDRDMRAFGTPTKNGEEGPDWIASSGSPTKCDLRDVTSISFNIKQAIQRNKDKRIRVVTDVLSPLLVLNAPEAMYSYWSQLLNYLKEYDAVMLAMVDEGMHPPSTMATMEQLFDGVIELKIHEDGLSITPYLRIKKMLGVTPIYGYFRFSVSRNSMEVAPIVR